MGVKYLNKFLLKKCSKNAIKKLHISNFANSIFVIDASIYIYKYLGENALMENMYLFLSIMQEYKIDPVFVFDGKPPPEKRELLKQRSLEKKEAEIKYDLIQQKIVDASFQNIFLPEKNELLAELDLLKSQFIRVKETHTSKVKTVLDAFGVSYFESPCEADHLCAYFTTKKEHDKQIYCVSDDMDMFIYGSRYIIRNINISNKTLWFYDRNKVLDELELTSKELQEILILSGTDYNLDTNTSLSETIKWFQSYKKIIKKENTDISFYDWLVENTKYIKEYDKLITVYNYFTIDYLKIFENYNVELIQKKEKDENKIKEIMIEEGFIFLK
tara:strand:- start:5417 stop:6406 length:990 start_codon:yes stop_codon:yes gene_type:complete